LPPRARNAPYLQPAKAGREIQIKGLQPEGKSQHKSLGLTIPETLLATADEVIQ